MKIICNHCGYEWEYGGSSQFYASCPRCLYKVRVPLSDTGETPHPSMRDEIKNQRIRGIKELEKLLPLIRRSFGSPTIEKLEESVEAMKKELKKKK